MKLIYCINCNDFFALSPLKPSKYLKFKTCRCRKSAGKYLSDGVTAVVTDKCIIAGIDNNTFKTAVMRYADVLREHPEYPRLDFFFTGWIPTKPGEVIRVSSIKEVKEYPFEVKEKTIYSTMPISQ